MSISQRRIRWIALALFVAAAASVSVASALAGGGKKSAGTIDIGYLNALSGPYAVAGGPELSAVKLGVTDVNASGGVCSKKVRLAATADDQGQANLSVAGLRKLVQQNGLKIIIGPGITPPMRAAAPVAEALKVFIIGETAQRDPWQGRKYVFSSVTPQDIYAPLMVSYMAKKLGPGKHKVGILWANVPYAQFGFELLKSAIAQRGWEIVASDNWDVTKFDFTSQAQKITTSNPEGLFFWGAATPADAQILKQVRSSGYTGPAVGDVAYTLPFIPTVAGNAAAATIVAPSQLNTVNPDPATKKFLAAYKKSAKSDATFLAGQAYDVVHIIAAAVKRAGCKDDPTSLSKAMIGLTYKGVNGVYNYTSKYKGGPLGKSFFEITYKDGHQVFAP
jgi:ABC-type branched-subunit amino acid transport system substrate-binding protein